MTYRYYKTIMLYKFSKNLTENIRQSKVLYVFYTFREWVAIAMLLIECKLKIQKCC